MITKVNFVNFKVENNKSSTIAINGSVYGRYNTIEEGRRVYDIIKHYISTDRLVSLHSLKMDGEAIKEE
jgi:hypothetical protein